MRSHELCRICRQFTLMFRADMTTLFITLIRQLAKITLLDFSQGCIHLLHILIWAIFNRMLSCRKRKKSKGICNKSLENITIFGSIALLLLLFGLFLYCFYFVYTNGFLPNKTLFKWDKTPVQTMTKSLHLEKSILGRFFLTKYFCHLCVQLVKGALL